jgi:hypothetical protein
MGRETIDAAGDPKLTGYATTNTTKGNHVLANDQRSSVANGETVGRYVNVILESIKDGHIDEDMRAQLHDLIPEVDTSLVNSLLENKVKVNERRQSLLDTAIAEKVKRGMSDEYASLQAFSPDFISEGNTTEANSEFLSQCLLAARTLEIPGKPLRNFNLLLNMWDLDGQRADVSLYRAGRNQEGYSNIEGMRQLAMGLNILAQVVKKHENVYVVVGTEGGRDERMLDAENAVAMFMGPGRNRSAKLVDHVYLDPQAKTDQTHDFHKNPNGSQNTFYYRGGELKTFSGTAVPDKRVEISDVMHGVVKFIAETHDRPGTTSGLENYVSIKTTES